MKPTAMIVIGAISLVAIMQYQAEAIKFIQAKPDLGPPALLAGPIFAAELQHQQPLLPVPEQQEIRGDLGTKGGLRQGDESLRTVAIQPQQPYYPAQQPYYPPQQGYGYQGRPQQPAVAYVIIRPVLSSPFFEHQRQQPYYSSYLFRPQEPLNQPLQPQPQQQLVESQPLAGTKGGELVKQEAEAEGPQAAVAAKGVDKFAKLKSSFDKLKAKLTLGSSYLVQSEEIVAPPAPPAPQLQREPLPLEQQQVKQGQEEDIRLTQQEQERIRDAERQEQQQIQAVEQEKLAGGAVKQQQSLVTVEERKVAQYERQPVGQEQEGSFDRRQQQQQYIQTSQEAAPQQPQQQQQHQQDIQRLSRGQQQQL